MTAQRQNALMDGSSQGASQNSVVGGFGFGFPALPLPTANRPGPRQNDFAPAPRERNWGDIKLGAAGLVVAALLAFGYHVWKTHVPALPPVTAAELRADVAAITSARRAEIFKESISFGDYLQSLTVAMRVRPQVRKAWRDAADEMLENVEPKGSYKPRSQEVADKLALHAMTLASLQLAKDGFKDAAGEAAGAALEIAVFTPFLAAGFEGELALELEKMTLQIAARAGYEAVKAAAQAKLIKGKAQATIWYDRSVAQPVLEKVDKAKDVFRSDKPESTTPRTGPAPKAESPEAAPVESKTEPGRLRRWWDGLRGKNEPPK